MTKDLFLARGQPKANFQNKYTCFHVITPMKDAYLLEFTPTSLPYSLNSMLNGGD